ncbi:MAG TPA: ParB/RepB/Spo0J family partition protein [Blastocatellia bacterium]|nr:ParB/RepB/Spo0J family partition protein [Blastocatellia bacterium]
MTRTQVPSGPHKALGRGLNALLADRGTRLAQSAEAASAPLPGETLRIAIDLIDPNPFQPRRIFQSERLQELAQSIGRDGLIQPIVVQRSGARYTLIVGERRWRAARLAGLTEVTAVVQDIPPDRLLEVTLVENIQREDLNPIETAQAFERMIRELNISHEEVARRTGKDRTTITNLLRLLKLPPDIQQLVAERRISMGHARAILGLPDEQHQRAVAEKASAQGLSVRQVERLVQRMTEKREVAEAEDAKLDPNVAAALKELEQALGTRVRIVEKGEKGRIEINYYSAEDLDRIYSLIVRS